MSKQPRQLRNEFLENEELLNNLEISLKNSLALQGCIQNYIDTLQSAFKDNGLIYHLANLEEMESITTMLYRELREAHTLQNELYSKMEAQAKL